MDTSIAALEAFPVPTDPFARLGLGGPLLSGVRELGYERPTEIQSQVIPPALLGRDVVGTAQTGTGKTAAFLLPVLQRLLGRPKGRLRALILTPTRELAAQADEFLRGLGGSTGLRGVAVYGGVAMGPQVRALRGGADILVATPGRLLDHLRRGSVDLRAIEILVLDEADRMLDMGFLPQVQRLLERLPIDRQTMLFSATMPSDVMELSRRLLRDPLRVAVRSPSVAAQGVSHHAVPVISERKTELLCHLLRDPAMSSVLVFVRTKRRADRLADQLGHDGVPVGRIHGGRSQSQRIEALEQFRRGHRRVLVATDIAARGVDVAGVSHVINYDVPDEPTTYVHRVGRTARAKTLGAAYTFVAPEESRDLARIERHLGHRIPDYRPGPSPEISSRPPSGQTPASAVAPRRGAGQNPRYTPIRRRRDVLPRGDSSGQKGEPLPR